MISHKTGRKLVRFRIVWILVACVAVLGTWLTVFPALKLIELKSLASVGREGATAAIEEVRYRSEGKEIVADLYLPRRPLGHVVFAHGNRPDGRRHALARALASALGRHFVTLAFDFRGYGQSGPLGPYEPGETLDFSGDIVAGARYLAGRFDIPVEQVVLVGHSFGSIETALAGRKLGARLVVPIGSGDPELLMTRSEFADGQARKLRAIGWDVSATQVVALYEPLFAKNVYQVCYPGDLLFISGEFEDGLDGLAPILDRLRQECSGKVDAINIPFANHMYWSEDRSSKRYRAYSILISELDWVNAVVGVIVCTAATEARREGC